MHRLKLRRIILTMANDHFRSRLQFGVLELV